MVLSYLVNLRLDVPDVLTALPAYKNADGNRSRTAGWYQHQQPLHQVAKVENL